MSFNLAILVLSIQLGLLLAQDTCVDNDVTVCRPRMWPPWWGMRGPIPCNERKYKLMLYNKCRRTCNFCDEVTEGQPAPCAESPCLNGGTCVNKGANYICICDDAFTGDNCQEQHSCSAPGYKPAYFQNLCYKLYTGNLKTYSEAKAHCVLEGGSLAVIDSYDTYDLFRSLLKVDQFVEGSATSGYWIDGKDEGNGFYYSNGRKIFLFFTGIDPERRQQSNPICLSLFWDDRLTGEVHRSCDTSLNFICTMPTSRS